MIVKRKYKVAFLSTHPIQYYAPLFRRLAKESSLDVSVYYYSNQGAQEYTDTGFGRPVKWDVPLLEGYTSKLVPNLWKKDTVGGFFSLINPALLGEIRKGRYDAVCLHGHAYFSDWIGLFAARLFRIPLFYRSESSLTYDRFVRRSLLIRFFKPRVMRFLFRQISRFLAIGALNREYFLHYGVDSKKIFNFPLSVDNEYFSSKAAGFRIKRDELRRELGIGPDTIVFLFAAKLIPEKSPFELLRAYAQLADLPNRALIMAGDGELRSDLEAFAKENRLSNVHFAGFINQSELPKYFAMSDVFVRPDSIGKGDWGLTVNEAMASGLALVCADLVGAAVDLLKEGENGALFRYGDTEDLARALRQVGRDPTACREMGKRSAEIIGHWSYEEDLNGLLEALESLEPRRTTLRV